MYKHKDPHFVTGNEFKATFEWQEHTVTIMKAVDEETDKHYIVVYISQIKELNVEHIQFPMAFDTTEQRDSEYDNFSVVEFMEFLISEIKKQQDAHISKPNQSS